MAEISVNPSDNFRRLTVTKAVVLHLFPGILALGFYFLIQPVVYKYGFSAAYAHFLTILLVLVPAELGYLFYQGAKNGTGLKGTIFYRESLPFRQNVLFVAILFLWAIFIFLVATPSISKFLFQNIFKDFADWFYYSAKAGLTSDFQTFSAITLLLDVLIVGLVNPVVHELYFRGHLLPRISHLGVAAPVINALLFAFSRFFFAPWLTPARFLVFLPLAYITWRKKNIWIAIWAHILIDNITVFLLFFQ